MYDSFGRLQENLERNRKARKRNRIYQETFTEGLNAGLGLTVARQRAVDAANEFDFNEDQEG